jgi:hypothetical protein
MGNKLADPWIREVEGALKRYPWADELERHPVRLWAAVQELDTQNARIAIAIRQVLDQALNILEVKHPEGTALLRERYLQGRSIEAMTTDYGKDTTNLHRWRKKLVKELAVVIAEHNHRAARRARAQRFAVHHPVFGFEDIMLDVVARLRNENEPAVIILEGMGGLGKTTLAKKIAHHFIVDDSFVRVLWVSAKQVDFDVWGGKRQIVQAQPLNPDDILYELARELNINMHGDFAIIRTEVLAHCRRRPYLIVLDNLETVVDLTALAPLIEQLVGLSRVLITTRERAPDVLSADLFRYYVPMSELDAATSFQLLRTAATYTKAPMLALASDTDLAHIYTVTGGNPLALWLVAGQAHGVPWTTFIRDLVEHCPRDSTGYELYHYLYQRSWEQLTPNARTVLFAMHRCRTGAPYDLLHALSILNHTAFLHAIDELERRMLLMFDGQQYYIHQLTYSFLRVVIAGWWN